MTRVLVTGGAGYIGGTAVKMLLAAGFEVNVLDDCSTGHEDSVDPRATFILGSILDKNAVLTALNDCDAVMHFAAKSLVPESVEKPDLYMHVNVDGSTNLLDCMKELGVHKIVFSSTAATYGEPKEVPITEESLTEPTNPYGASKLKVDQLLTTRAATDGIAAISLRYFNVAGSLKTQTGWHAERHNPETHLIPNVLKATEERPLKVFGADWPTPDHTCVRDYIHVVDLIEAHISALHHLETGKHQIINLGSGDGYSVKQVIDTASAVVEKQIPFTEESRRAGDPAVLIASVDKAQSVLGWRPTRNLESMIRDAYESIH
jgi:UDP-glucose 4-epimerase